MTKHWGPCTWILFHTLAEKVKEETFHLIKTELLNMIIAICHNLYCPECTAHAKNKLKTLRKDKILVKEDLKKVLWSFHNSVNVRTKKKIFTYEELNEKYKNEKLVNVINKFLEIWNMKNTNPNMIADNFHRKKVVSEFKKWIQVNKEKFNFD